MSFPWPWISSSWCKLIPPAAAISYQLTLYQCTPMLSGGNSSSARLRICISKEIIDDFIQSHPILDIFLTTVLSDRFVISFYTFFSASSPYFESIIIWLIANGSFNYHCNRTTLAFFQWFFFKIEFNFWEIGIGRRFNFKYSVRQVKCVRQLCAFIGFFFFYQTFFVIRDDGKTIV